MFWVALGMGVMFQYFCRKKGDPRGVRGRLCGQRTNAGRIIKESYGTAKQQHTFTVSSWLPAWSYNTVRQSSSYTVLFIKLICNLG